MRIDRWLLGGAALALAACLFDPGWTATRERYDHVVVLDITQSMNVEDEALNGKPASRLVYAKALLRDALLQLPCGSKVGWGVFTEYRALLLFEPVEVCANLAELRATLAHIDNRMSWNGGSEIAKGIHSGIAIVKELDDRPSLVFVTDGHESPPLNPRHRPAFDDKPGDALGVLVGVGALHPSPIPKTDPMGRPLGFWRADEVAQTDPYSQGRGASVSGERMADDAASVPDVPDAASGSEHLSSLHEAYLRLLSRELGLSFLRLDSEAGLVEALTAPGLARPASVRADARTALAIGALVLLLTRQGRRMLRRRR
ncbi:MAG: VWA domain-containing protein [Proteobacteria bacterium]|nr:VWA domain-containing protein [Pseudomonadota bacterium]